MAGETASNHAATYRFLTRTRNLCTVLKKRSDDPFLHGANYFTKSLNKKETKGPYRLPRSLKIKDIIGEIKNE